MRKITILVAVAALATTPAYAKGFNADVHAGINSSKIDQGVGDNGTQATYGAGLGYDFDLNEKVFAGVQGTIDGVPFGSGLGTHVSYAVVARIGTKLTDKDSIYALGGYVNQSLPSAFGVGDNAGGFRLGAGYERSLTDKLFAKVEYRFSQYKKAGYTGTSHDGLVGVGIHF